MSTPRAHSAHAPVGGRMRRWLGPFYVTGALWYRLHLFGVSILPRWAVGPFILLFTTFFFVALRRIRRAVGRNLVPLLGETGWLGRQARIYRTLWSFAWCLSERYEQLGPGRRAEVETEGLENWRALSDRPEGFLVVTAHVGNWEVGSMMPATREGRRVNLVREQEIDPVAQSFVEELLRRRGGPGYVTHFAGRDPGLAVTLLEALRRGEIVALQADRPRAVGRTLPVELFGRPFTLPEGPFALARSAGAPLIPAFILRQGRLRYRVVLRPAIRVACTQDRGTDLQDAAAALAVELEAIYRRAPHQWFCFVDLWPAA